MAMQRKFRIWVPLSIVTSMALIWPIYRATRAITPTPGKTYRDNKWREVALVIEPIGVDQPVVPEGDLTSRLVSLLPRWRMKKTNSMLHAMRLWGMSLPEHIKDPLSVLPTGSIPSSSAILEALLDESVFRATRVKSQPFLYKTNVGIGVKLDSGGGVAHADQFLKTMGELGLEASRQISLRGCDRCTLNDVIRQSLYNFDEGQEMEFTAVALSRWLPPASEWLDRDGRLHSLDQICGLLLKKTAGQGSCGGVHVLYGLVNLLRSDDQFHFLKPTTRLELTQRLRATSSLLEGSQSLQGGWTLDWANPRKAASGGGLTNTDSFELILVTGHHLEWIALAPRDVRPNNDCIARAVSS